MADLKHCDMERKISFGKIAYDGGRKVNKVEIELWLNNEEEGKPIFSACANVWNARHTDVVCCGQQIFDEIRAFYKGNALFEEIYDLWSKYHCNDLHRGTQEQMAFLEEHKEELGEGRCYESELALLEKYGKEYAPDGSKFGSAWYYWPIPEEDLARIKKLFE